MTKRNRKILQPIPNYGEHMTLKSFMKSCENGDFIDYDGYGYYGYGYYATKTGMSNLKVYPSDVTRDKANKIKTGWTHVVWFNR